ncbi:maleylpyruvate isomerase N-terminal domain-containing protein [Kribbella sp. NPDC023972]|uniref:maleylpyruvate isomerase N-terminal domain-containing protein n=1 Tax=Kribbella sp. NPDC023972 TaxID=3154795 RepID=UPI0033C9BBCC
MSDAWPSPIGSSGDPIDYLAEFERTAAEFAAVLDRVDPAAAVPACPGWTLADLALHVGAGQRWAASILLSGTAQKVPEVLRTTISWADWYSGTTAALVAAIRAVDPDEPCWNFAPVEQRAGFWSRRRLHETAIHLVDAVQAGADPDQGAASGLTVVPPRLAADGVDEVFGVFLPRLLARGFEPAVTRQIGVRATDTGDEWTLTPVPEGPVSEGIGPRVERGKAAGEAVVSGTAAELDLCLWKRLPGSVLAVEGDAAVAAAFLDGRTTP